MKTLNRMAGAALFTAVLFLLIVAGCDDDPSSSQFTDNQGPINNPINDPSCKVIESVAGAETVTQRAESVRRAPEQYLHELEDQIDGFGGIFIDENETIVIYLTDDANAESAGGSFSDERFARHGLTNNRPVEIRRADYRFRELAAWREIVTSVLLSGSRFDHVLTSFVNEAENRVSVGIHYQYYDESAKAEIHHFLEETYQVPPAAVTFVKEWPEGTESDDATAGLEGSIQDRQRPLVGGLRIRYGSSSLCTMGFMGLFDDKEVFVTNGHCSDVSFHLSHTLYYQGDRGEPSDVIGTQIADGVQSTEACTTPNSDCWPCRWSDAGIVQLRDDVSAERGTIARPDVKSSEWMVDGGLEIDQQSPVFNIVDLEPEVLMGMELHKVGGNSGWTSGEVIRTCYDSRRSNHSLILQCQHRARYASSGGGTSGSPVFVKLDDHPETDAAVSLIGIHWGSSRRDHPGGYTTFSSVDGILSDFPDLHGLTRELEGPVN
jgi:hypothetical protein